MLEKHKLLGLFAHPDDEILAPGGAVARKWTAFHCHATQFGPDNLFRQLPETEIAELFTHEYFALAHPEPAPNLRLNGLFDGIT